MSGDFTDCSTAYNVQWIHKHCHFVQLLVALLARAALASFQCIHCDMISWSNFHLYVYVGCTLLGFIVRKSIQFPSKVSVGNYKPQSVLLSPAMVYVTAFVARRCRAANEPRCKTTIIADATHCELADLHCLGAMHRGATKQIRQQAGPVCVRSVRRTQLAVEIK